MPRFSYLLLRALALPAAIATILFVAPFPGVAAPPSIVSVQGACLRSAGLPRCRVSPKAARPSLCHQDAIAWRPATANAWR